MLWHVVKPYWDYVKWKYRLTSALNSPIKIRQQIKNEHTFSNLRLSCKRNCSNGSSEEVNIKWLCYFKLIISLKRTRWSNGWHERGKFYNTCWFFSSYSMKNQKLTLKLFIHICFHSFSNVHFLFQLCLDTLKRKAHKRASFLSSCSVFCFLLMPVLWRAWR